MNPLKYYRIFDEEPCPCGSGMKYSLCCKKREDSFQRDNKRPVEVQAAEILKKSQYKCCLHPDKSRCVKHIKEAHALQNNKIISLLSENGHVYMLNDKKSPLIIPTEKGEIETLTLLDKVGVNRATTATCFCDIHDDEVFAAIEKGAPAFDKGNDEHKFLYAYKAFIFEYYKKLVEQKAFQRMIKAKPSVLKSRMMVAYYRDISLTMREMDTVKDTFDKAILANDYGILQTCVIEIPGSIGFANYACIAPDYDLYGRKIKNTKNGIMRRLYITVFPEENRSFILLSCLHTDSKVYKDFFQQLQAANVDKVKYYFDLMLPLYSENIIISPRLWEHWTEEQQTAFTFYINLHGHLFSVYRLGMKFAMQNCRNQTTGFGDGKRGKIDLFAKT